MAIECPGCGRHYDVTLFQFGRTIHCSCGTRVGRERLERPVATGSEVRFLCDAMLGRLARWLRALGYDVAYDPAADDAELVRRAAEEDRWLLTCDRALAEEWRTGRCVVVEAGAPRAQLREVTERLRLRPAGVLFRRCLRCNALLEPADPGEVKERVPERVRRRRGEFRACPACGRIYWEGSHTRRMRKVLESVFRNES